MGVSRPRCRFSDLLYEAAAEVEEPGAESSHHNQ